MKILVCGGAGYIGSHFIKNLRKKNRYEVAVLDNFSTGHKWALQGADCFEVDLLDSRSVNEVFASNRFDIVVHFAANSIVSESFEDPLMYYRNNVVGSLNLITAMERFGVKNMVFSSTASVYGNPIQLPIEEGHSTLPVSPYGKTKLMIETMLSDAYKSYNINSIILRYFNAAGADPDGEIGESHYPETHLIPSILKSLGTNVTGSIFEVFGDDYDTNDGTCVRDYVHVMDLAEAHEKSINYMISNPGSHIFNLGNGAGFSVKEIISACESVTGLLVEFEVSEKRKGDPSVLIANTEKAKLQLDWSPRFKDISSIVETAWNWHKKSQGLPL